MKKDLIFAPLTLVIGALLFLLRATGMAAHVAISIVGVALLVVYAVLTKKEWKLPALEIAMRAAYGLALISGIVIKISYVFAVAIAHKILAALFVVLLSVYPLRSKEISLCALKLIVNEELAERVIFDCILAVYPF